MMPGSGAVGGGVGDVAGGVTGGAGGVGSIPSGSEMYGGGLAGAALAVGMSISRPSIASVTMEILCKRAALIVFMVVVY
jgi:hypothetical protein